MWNQSKNYTEYLLSRLVIFFDKIAPSSAHETCRWVHPEQCCHNDAVLKPFNFIFFEFRKDEVL
jgi:hypothetical protein